jgi:nicotinate-nucleotide adenylyltransferase
MSPRGGIGILGGTFNPIHLGHLRAAEEVSEILDLERVVFVPSAEPPHKEGERERIAPAKLRCEWVRRAIADNPRFAVDPLEIERTGPSYSVATLRSFGERLAPEKPIFVIGQDAFAEIETWREPSALFTLSHFAVINRPPGGEDSLAEQLPARFAQLFDLDREGEFGRHRTAGTWIRRIRISALDVSATDIRRRIREGRSVRYLVPEMLRREVTRSGTYAEKNQA